MPIAADHPPLWEDGRRSTRVRLSSSPPPHIKTAAERLNDDLLVEILSRVPARSLCRFKCVPARITGSGTPTYLCGVEVYSSETGRWVHKESEWNDTQLDSTQSASVFLNGYLHFHALDCVSSRCLAVVDTKGEELANFRVPRGLQKGYIRQSQGCLHYANFRRDEDGAVVRLVVYVLEDYGSKEWTLKHSVETSYIFGANLVYINPDYDWIMIHPDCNLIFFNVGQNIFKCYNMDRRKTEVIPDSTINGLPPYRPYVPLYSDLPSLDM